VGLSHYLGSLLRRWHFVVAGLILGGGTALGLLQVLTPTYTSNIQLFVTTSGITDLATAAQGGEFSQQRTASYAQLIQGRDLAARVIEELDLDLTTGELLDRLSVSVLPDTVLLDVTVTDTSAERALAVAESIGEQFAALVGQLETPKGGSEPSVQVSVVATPQLPDAPSSPQVVPTLAAGLVLGFLLGAVVAVVRDRLDTSIRSEAAIAETAGVPTLGVVPHADAEELGAADLGAGPFAEAYRLVRTNLQFVSVDTHPRVLMITSADQGEGKTTTSIHLAHALVQTGLRVLLVEADLRRPRVTSYLGLIAGAGLTNVLTGTATADEVLQPVGSGALSVLAAGPLPPNPSELLSSDAMRNLLATASDSWDLVLVDAAPLLPVADAAGLAALVDGVVVAVRWGQTREDGLRRSKELLDRAGARLLGCVLTFAPRRAGGPYTYGYGEAPADRRVGVRS
jgi:capsular exopolysaccharide synthesis family protein